MITLPVGLKSRADEKALRLCDLALNKCGIAFSGAKSHIKNLQDVIDEQEDVIQAQSTLAHKYRKEKENLDKYLPYYVLGAFVVGAGLGVIAR